MDRDKLGRLLAHLSTKCSCRAIVIVWCLSSVVDRPLPSVVRRQQFALNSFFSEDARPVFIKLHWNVRCFSVTYIKIAQIVPLRCKKMATRAKKQTNKKKKKTTTKTSNDISVPTGLISTKLKRIVSWEVSSNIAYRFPLRCTKWPPELKNREKKNRYPLRNQWADFNQTI